MKATEITDAVDADADTDAVISWVVWETWQTAAVVPFTCLALSASCMSDAVRISCPSLQ